MIKELLYQAARELIGILEEAITDGLDEAGKIIKKYKSEAELLYMEKFQKEQYEELRNNMKLYRMVMSDLNEMSL